MATLRAEPGVDAGRTSRHFAVLQRTDAVESRREGTNVFCPSEVERVSDFPATARGISGHRPTEQQPTLFDLDLA